MKTLGRPRTEHPRSNVIPSRYTDDELALIRAAATRAGIPAAQFIRERAIAAAKRAR